MDPSWSLLECSWIRLEASRNALGPSEGAPGAGDPQASEHLSQKCVFDALVRVPALFLTSDLARQGNRAIPAKARGFDAACKEKSARENFSKSTAV